MLRMVAAASLPFSSGFSAEPPAPGAFEAVSIKANKSGDRPGGLRALPGGRVDATNVPLKVLIEWAYQVREFQISGEPAWVDSERFDVATKADGNPRTDFLHPEIQTMFRSVLADRFMLSFHRDIKEQAVFMLRVAKNGPKIHSVGDGDCSENPPPDNPCRSLRMTKFGHIEGLRSDMRGLAMLLSGPAGKIVLDKTDLKGDFSFSLDWTKYLQPPQMPPGVDPPPRSFDPTSVQPAISEALEEQLGLKLESQKGPVEVLVIDHVERPSEN